MVSKENDKAHHISSKLSSKSSDKGKNQGSYSDEKAFKNFEPSEKKNLFSGEKRQRSSAGEAELEHNFKIMSKPDFKKETIESSNDVEMLDASGAQTPGSNRSNEGDDMPPGKVSIGEIQVEIGNNP